LGSKVRIPDTFILMCKAQDDIGIRNGFWSSILYLKKHDEGNSRFRYDFRCPNA
jgi:hypothetical protein